MAALPNLYVDLLAAATGELAPDPHDRIVVFGDHALLERDDRVVGDLDRFRADVGAALGDVAVAQPGPLLIGLPARCAFAAWLRHC